jgi:prepilin-type N-terminal cleavage/methylation domain-containing protein
MVTVPEPSHRGVLLRAMADAALGARPHPLTEVSRAPNLMFRRGLSVRIDGSFPSATSTGDTHLNGKRRHGFTLIELLVVIAIILIISSPASSTARDMKINS